MSWPFRKKKKQKKKKTGQKSPDRKGRVIHGLIVGNRGGRLVNVQDCDIIVGEFELHSRYYVQVRINTLRKSINSLIPPPSYVLNSTTTVLLQGLLWH